MFEREKWRKLASIKLYIVNTTVCLGQWFCNGAMEKLILLVSEYLCLYQMELPEYNNIVMKNNAW